MLLANTDLQIESMIQYGCFGLLSALVFWSIWKGIPTVLALHKEVVTGIASEHRAAITQLVQTFNEEAKECREERISVAKDAATEREKDRMLRHETNNTLQKLMGKVEGGT